MDRVHKIFGAIIALLMLTLCLSGVQRCTAARARDRLAVKAEKLDAFCRMTRVAQETSIRSLETPQPPRARTVALEMIERDMAHFGYSSVHACLGTQTPSTDELAECKLDSDRACIAQQLRRYRDALAKGGW